MYEPLITLLFIRTTHLAFGSTQHPLTCVDGNVACGWAHVKHANAQLDSQKHQKHTQHRQWVYMLHLLKFSFFHVNEKQATCLLNQVKSTQASTIICLKGKCIISVQLTQKLHKQQLFPKPVYLTLTSVFHYRKTATMTTFVHWSATTLKPQTDVGE